MGQSTTKKSRIQKAMLLTSAVLLIMLLLSACGGNPQNQEQATRNKAGLDKALADATMIGVPDSMLQPIKKQEGQISQTFSPFAIGVDQYYTNLAQRYKTLQVQVVGLQAQVTQQFDYQATLDLNALAAILSQRQSQGFAEATTFANQLTQYQQQMNEAHYPKHYLQISHNAQATTQALRLMGTTYDKITTLEQTIKQLQASHLDTTAAEQQRQDDLALFHKANKSEDFTKIANQVDAQLQSLTTFSTQAIPYVGAAKLKQLSANIDLMKQYGIDTSSFQQSLDKDQAKLNQARTINDFLSLSAQIDADLNTTQFPLLKGQANYLLKQFHQEVTDWGNAHQYHNAFNGTNYPLAYEYDMQGVGSDASDAVQFAQTADDYQAAINFTQNEMTNLKAMEADYNDTTPWNQPHATDTQLLQYYKATSGQVIVVSLVEQALRLYQDGKLIHAFQITSGQYDKPSVPGFWHIFDRESPTTFKSSEPKGSAFWYPDTKINVAMAYHDGGYFFHDSWWRVNYGPGTNFPHYDVGGDESFSGNGSHGCINMPEDQATWLYNNTGYGTAVIIY